LITPEGKKINQLTYFTKGQDNLNFPRLRSLETSQIVWSNDGKKIFITLHSSLKTRDLYTIDILSKKLIKLSNVKAPEFKNYQYGYLYLSLSPDNKSVLVQANFTDYEWSKDYDYISMNSDGSNIINLSKKYSKIKDSFSCYWSVDSKRIAFISYKGNDQIKIFSIKTDGANVIENDLNFIGTGDEWSPDGRRFVYPENSPLGYQVFMTSTKGVEVKNISNTLVVGGEYPPLRGYGFPSPWSKDGSKIGVQIFHPNRIGELDDYRIFIIEKDGTTFEIPNIRDDFPWNPSWSPDGKEIIYEGEGREIYITDLKGNKRKLRKSRNLSGFAAGEQYVFWFENGKICYYAKPPPEKDYQKVMDVFLINPDGSGEVNLTKDLYLTWFPIWNYDHSKFIFTDIDEKDKLFIYNVKKRRVTLTVKDFANFGSIDTSFCWSYDNKTFFATRNDKTNSKILALNTNNGKIEELLSIPIKSPKEEIEGRMSSQEGIGDLLCSPDGEKIAFIIKRFTGLDKEHTFSELYIFNLKKRELKQLTNISLSNFSNLSKHIKNYGDFNPQFTPDSSKIVFESNKDGNGEIYVINIDGTQLRNLSKSPADDVVPKICPMPTE